MQTAHEAQVEMVWKTCPMKLERLEVGKRQARSLIGKWLKTSAPTKVMEAICAAERIGTLDPIPYVTEALKANKPVANTLGIESGSTIRVNTWNRVQPSSCAASSISMGMRRKNTERMSTVNGIVITV